MLLEQKNCYAVNCPEIKPQYGKRYYYQRGKMPAVKRKGLVFPKFCPQISLQNFTIKVFKKAGTDSYY
jgi:hypothetical protein